MGIPGPTDPLATVRFFRAASRDPRAALVARQARYGDVVQVGAWPRPVIGRSVEGRAAASATAFATTELATMTAAFVRRVDAALVDPEPPVGVGIASVAPRDGVRIRVHSVAPAPGA